MQVLQGIHRLLSPILALGIGSWGTHLIIEQAFVEHLLCAETEVAVASKTKTVRPCWSLEGGQLYKKWPVGDVL